MTRHVRLVINGLWALLMLGVIVDHFAHFTYDHLIRHMVRTDLSLYIEITSIIFTMGVPFFYSLYKRRENELEEMAIESGGGVGELEKARARNDPKIIVYYSLMALFVVVVTFVQSSIINAGKAETSTLETTVLELRQELTGYQKQIAEMNSRLARLDSVLEKLSGQNTEFQMVLSEVRLIRSSADSIAKQMRKAAEAVGVPRRKGEPEVSTGFATQLQDLETLMDELAKSSSDLQQEIRGALTEFHDDLGGRIADLSRRVARIEALVERAEGNTSKKARPPETTSNAESTLSKEDIRQIKLLVGKYYEDFAAVRGSFEVPPIGSPDAGLLNSFRQYLHSSGQTLDEVKGELKGKRYLLERALDLCKRGQLQVLASCKRKLQWLLWILEAQ